MKGTIKIKDTEYKVKVEQYFSLALRRLIWIVTWKDYSVSGENLSSLYLQTAKHIFDMKYRETKNESF